MQFVLSSNKVSSLKAKEEKSYCKVKVQRWVNKDRWGRCAFKMNDPENRISPSSTPRRFVPNLLKIPWCFFLVEGERVRFTVRSQLPWPWTPTMYSFKCLFWHFCPILKKLLQHILVIHGRCSYNPHRRITFFYFLGWGKLFSRDMWKEEFLFFFYSFSLQLNLL